MKKQHRGSLKYLTREGFRNVWVNRLMSIASVAVLMSCLVMMGAAYMVLVNVESIMKQVEGENVIMVYLDLDATPEQVSAVRKQIEATPNVSGLKFNDKETAFKDVIEDLDTDATYFEGIKNPLPDLFEVSVDDMTRFNTTANALAKIENVDLVRDNKEIAGLLIQVRTTVVYASMCVIGILLLISLFIIANTIRITMFNRRLEINIMKSVGATNWFIRWPFIIEGMVLGFISALISFGLVWGLYALLEPTVTSAFKAVIYNFKMVPFAEYAVPVVLVFVLIGILSGGLGSLISIQKYLRERGGVVYDEAE